MTGISPLAVLFLLLVLGAGIILLLFLLLVERHIRQERRNRVRKDRIGRLYGLLGP